MRLDNHNLTREKVRELNAILIPRGRKMCLCGANHPLDTDHFYSCYDKRTDRRYWSTDCKDCHRATANRRVKAAYRKSKQKRLVAIARAKTWRLTHPNEYREHTRVSRANRRRELFRVVVYGD